ncbi:MAG TPA: bifunctional YncE family protein/alkaline phosphatase family protein [Verrucomicrobiae bacterium]|nr:bifunctional YncE family protein/alkaline phosphatase family protein [Verrucomicrobiae bacterium]
MNAISRGTPSLSIVLRFCKGISRRCYGIPSSGGGWLVLAFVAGVFSSACFARQAIQAEPGSAVADAPKTGQARARAPIAVQTRAPGEDVDSPSFRTRQHLAPNRNLLFNGLGLSPAGEAVRISDMALKMVIAPDGKAVVAVCSGYNQAGVNLVGLDGKRTMQFISLKEAFNGLAFAPDGKKFYVTGGDRGAIYVFKYSSGKAELEKEVQPNPDENFVFLAGMTVQASSGIIYVCNEANHEVWVLEPETLKLERTIAVGQHPHSCLIGGDGRHLYVSNWGSRSVSIIDTKLQRRVRDLMVGVRPNDMALAPDGRLFVACAGDNTVHVIATGHIERPGEEPGPTRRLWEGSREIISTSLYPQSPEGSTPCGVAVSPDGKTLFVVNADQNSVLVADISGALMEDASRHGEKISVVNGFIPVGWYPTAVAVSPDNRFLLVANGKGLMSRQSYPPKFSSPTKGYRGVGFDTTGRIFEGSISFIPRPDTAQMAAYTEQVRRNSSYHPEHLMQAPLPGDTVIPAHVGDPCPIKYVIYIIKENRTYDQVLGDMTDAQGRPLGNGDPKLTIYGEKVTPNQHALAREYVLFDDLFSNSEVSVDGHSWCDAAMATDFNQRSWIISYSRHGRLPGNEEMETPVNGYLWDLCRRNGVSFKTYGEGSQRVPSVNRGDWSGGRDTARVKHWIADLYRAEQSGDMPRFSIMALGENHTQGTRPGAPTPEACVGNNDLALGQLVEAASHSRFWNQMAIFVIEDDTQNGPDHVDAHRTAGFVISPYCKRHFVDSTLYTTASMVRTIELILGLPPLTQFDAGATPMFNCFQSQPIATQWAVLTPQVDLNARNTAKSPYAKESSRMNFKAYDLAPEDELNRILWAEARPSEPYPAPIHRMLFTRALGQ